MKTTLNISDVTMDHLRREAARQGRTMPELVEAAIVVPPNLTVASDVGDSL